MKKLLFFVAAAAMMTACSTEELANPGNNQDPNGDPINFSVYTPRTTTRAGVPGSITDTNLKDGSTDLGKAGFGIFGYFTAGTTYDQNATPNFMYNQQVKYDGSKWKYEPVKYWPNEYGNAAQSDDIDRVSFFAYAPWTEVTPSSGLPIYKPLSTDAEYDAFANSLGLTGVTTLATYMTTYGYNSTNYGTDDAAKTAAKAALDAIHADQIQNKNIIEMSKNNATGDPIIKYVVDTDPKTSVDLLYGVAAKTSATDYGTAIGDNTVSIEEGKPFIDLVKPNYSTGTEKLNFWLQHALAQIKVTIDYVADIDLANGTAPTANSNVIDNKYTRIFVRSVSFGGFAMKGALNLHSTKTMKIDDNYTVGVPLWKSLDGTSDLTFDNITFHDGRKDGREGATNGAQTSETPIGLNPEIIENEGYVVPVSTTAKTHWAATADVPAGQNEKNPGVKAFSTTTASQNLFGGTGNFFYVIPRNNGEGVSLTLAYDVETIDDNLAGKLSDNATHGISIENVITKDNIFGAGVDFKPGYSYTIAIHIGMTSVKVDAAVVPWQTVTGINPAMPEN